MNDLPASADLDGPPCDLAFVSNVDSALAQAVVARLAAIYPDHTLRHYNSIELAATGSKARIVLAMLPPLEDVARRLAAGAEADIAVTGWLDETEPLLAASRRYRRRLWCVDARSMAAGLPDALALPDAVAGAVAQIKAFPLPPSITLVIAELLIAHHPAAARLAMEISAMVRGPKGVAVNPDLLAQAQTDVMAMRRVDAAQQAELHLLRDNLTLQTDRAEAEALLRAERETEVARLGAEVETARITASDQHQELHLLRDGLTLQADRADAEALLRAEREAEVARLGAEVETARITASDQRQELHLLRDNLTLQVDRAEAETLLRAERDAEVARLTSESQAARTAVSEVQEELRLLRDNLLLQVDQAEAEARIRGTLEVEVADKQRLVVAHAQLAAEAEAMKHRLVGVIQLQRSRDAVIGRVLLSDQFAVDAVRARADRLAARLLNGEVARGQKM